MQIVNESDRDVTWWCYNSDDPIREHPCQGGTGDLSAKGGRVSYSPPSNGTGLYYVQFTNKDGKLTYAWWRPANAATLARNPSVRRDQTVTLRGSCGYQVVDPDGRAVPSEYGSYLADSGGYQAR
jgi:hypothetical protein